MCTLILLHRPDHPWPVLVAANRDEVLSRAWSPPGRHWPDRPEVMAGLDHEHGGSWMGLNDWGVMAAVLNGVGTLGPEPGRRSRGELVLEALDHADAIAAAGAMADLDPGAYRPFHLVLADSRDALCLSNRDGRILQTVLPQGLSMVTAHGADNPGCPRTRHHRQKWDTAPVPDPDNGAWDGWIKRLSDRTKGPDADLLGAMEVVTPRDYGTGSASLLALPQPGDRTRAPIWRFASGRPSDAPFVDVLSAPTPPID